MIFIIIGFLTMIKALKDYHKAFLVFLIYILFLVQNISVINIPGVPLLTLDLLMTIYFIGLFLYKRKSLKYDRTPFPLKKPFIYIAISYFISTVFAYAGFSVAFSAYAKDMCSHFLIAWLIWLLVEKSDIKWIFRWMTIAFFFISFYGLYEHSIESNPLSEYELLLMGNSDRALDYTYNADVGRGYRIKSVFEHAIGAGMMWGLYIVFFVSLIMSKQHRRYRMKSSVLPLVTLALCFLCIFFTNSRGPILFLGISMLGFVNFKSKRFYAFVIAVLLILYFATPILGDYFDNVLSIFDSKAQERVGGSNADMRFDQFAAASSLMSESPIIGLGYKYANAMWSYDIDRLLGGESMWFNILPAFGILGIIVNVILAFYEIVRLPKLFKSKSVFFLSLAYWVTASLTSVPGYIKAIHYLIVIMLIKQGDSYKPHRGSGESEIIPRF